MKVWSIPNLLTFLRLGLIPVFNYYFLTGEYGLALLFFLVAGVSDFFDGIFARLLKARTSLGAILDPAADKLLMAVTFIVLAMKGALPIWMAVLVFAKDLYVVSGILYVKFRGGLSKIRPSRLSKFNTGCQLILIALCLSYAFLKGRGYWDGYLEFWFHYLQQAGIYFTAGMTILTAIQYTILGWRLVSGANEDGTISGKKNEVGSERLPPGERPPSR